VVARAPKPSDRQRVALSVAYNPDATCPRWQRALSDWFGEDQDGAEKAALLAEFVGAALFGVATRYQKALFVVAPGGNGKSQLLDVVSALFPAGRVHAIRPQDWGNEYQRAELAGAMVNIVAELPTKAIAEGSEFKAIITGDPISARHIYQKPFTFRPRCAHIISGNAFPEELDTSDGFWRRLLVLTMTRRFDGTPEEIRDLAHIIIHEELDGVLAWAARGAKRLLNQNSYTCPASCQAAVDVWRKDSDPVALWIDARTSSCSEEDGGIRTTELFGDYRAWSETYCFPVLNLNNFSKALVRLLGPPKRSRAGRHHRLQLKPRTES
jgi:putative DNA primase/helicase